MPNLVFWTSWSGRCMSEVWFDTSINFINCSQWKSPKTSLQNAQQCSFLNNVIETIIHRHTQLEWILHTARRIFYERVLAQRTSLCVTFSWLWQWGLNERLYLISEASVWTMTLGNHLTTAFAQCKRRDNSSFSVAIVKSWLNYTCHSNCSAKGH